MMTAYSMLCALILHMPQNPANRFGDTPSCKKCCYELTNRTENEPMLGTAFYNYCWSCMMLWVEKQMDKEMSNATST